MVRLLLEQEHARAEAQSAHSFGFGINHGMEVDGNPRNRPHLSCTFWLKGDPVNCGQYTLMHDKAHFTKLYVFLTSSCEDRAHPDTYGRGRTCANGKAVLEP